MISDGIMQTLKNSKDPPVLKGLNKYIKFSTKLKLAKVYVNFLDECVNESVYPHRFVRTLHRNHVRVTKNSLRRHALNEKDTIQHQIEDLELKLICAKDSLELLNTVERQAFEAYVQTIVDTQKAKRQSKLHMELMDKERQSLFPDNPQKYVHNLSSLTLDKPLLEVLSLGPKFCIPSVKSRQLDLEVQFENLYNQLSDLQPTSELECEQLKATLVSSCYRYLNSRPSVEHIIPRAHLDALKRLRTNEDIIITKPDKGNGIVLLDKEDYVRKMTNLLSDTSKFLKQEKGKDQTKQIEKSIAKLLSSLKQRNLIDSSTFEKLRPTGTIVPRLYGLPKIHKPGTPLRPVLDMVNSPYHALAKWLCSRLEPVKKVLSQHCVRDVFEFVNMVKDMNVTDSTMLSLDVSSLFTNVPLKETVDFLCDFIETNFIDIGIPVADLKVLLMKCTSNVQFKFNGNFYRQTDGVAMGSPLGPLLADIFMAKLENNQLKSAINNCKVYARYVDDIFVMINANHDPMTLLDVFNKAHTNLKFTAELEDSGQLAFLDVCLTRRLDGTIQRTVFRKQTWNDQYVHFKSFVPMKLKVNLISCLVNRARKICSEDVLTNELEFLRKVFLKNGYPRQMIEKRLQATPERCIVPTVEKKNVYINLPFKGDTLTLLTEKKLSSAVNRAFSAARLRIFFTSTPAVRLQHKDKVPRSEASFCVYSFSCSCGTGYIGRTTRRLSERVREHIPAWIYSGVTKVVNSAVVAHLVESGHRVTATNAFRPLFKVCGRLPRPVKTRILATAEAIAIKRFNPDLCAQKQHVRALQLAWPTSERTVDTQQLSHN